ncbi:MAG: hypothetical protein ACRDZ3_20560 [Acidimicrobiia bacterium]
MIRRIRSEENGQVLVLALAFITFVGVVGVVLLNYATTNVKATVALRPVRSVEYAADGAIDGAINKLRHNPFSATCASGRDFYRTVINDQEIAVGCVRQVVSATSPKIVRATFTAKCYADTSSSTTTTAPTKCGAGSTLLSAQVLFQEQGSPPVVRTTVENWSVR